MSQQVSLIDSRDNVALDAEAQRINDVLVQSMSTAVSNTNSNVVIPPLAELLGIKTEVYEIISQALKVKRHLMFYGPPGTGKTTLAEYVAGLLNAGNYKLVTGTSDWTSQDLIGGYQPTSGGEIKFVKGLILENFDRPIIIDELNRVDIDKAIGPLFTVLSGQSTTLPYQLEPDSKDPNKQLRVQILPKVQGGLTDNQFAPSAEWRILATMNTVDKASLYQMSYALSRRFGWILIDVPEDLSQFIIDYLLLKNYLLSSPPSGTSVPLGNIWKNVNIVRPVGPAPIIDIIELCISSIPDFDFFDLTNDNLKRLYVNGFYTFLLPLLDGYLQVEAQKVCKGVIESLEIPENGELAKEIQQRSMYHSI